MAEPNPVPRKPVRRRSAEDAKHMLLEATEERLQMVGLDGIRLKDVAASVGVSHTLLLHHFGSREGLLEAVVNRRVGKLRACLIEALSAEDSLEPDETRRLLDRVCKVMGDPVMVRVLGWVGLSERSRFEPTGARTIRRIAQALHDARVRVHERRGDPAPEFEEAQFLVILAAAAVVGERVLEPVFLPSLGLDESPGARERYREWLCDRLGRLVEGRA